MGGRFRLAALLQEDAALTAPCIVRRSRGPGNRGLYSAGSTSEARSGWALPNTTHFTWVSVASSIEGNQIEKMEGPQNGKSSSVATPWGAVAASTAAR